MCASDPKQSDNDSEVLQIGHHLKQTYSGEPSEYPHRWHDHATKSNAGNIDFKAIITRFAHKCVLYVYFPNKYSIVYIQHWE